MLRGFLRSQKSWLQVLAFVAAHSALTTLGVAADVPGAQDPPDMRRFTGSEIIAYREPKFDEVLLPLGPPTDFSPPAYDKSIKVDGLVSRYTYLAAPGRTPVEILRNYKLEVQRLGLTIMYEKAAGEKGWFGPTFDGIADEDQLGQILSDNEKEERVLVLKSKAAKPTYYYLFVTAYADGVIPERLQSAVAEHQALAELIVIAPKKMDENMSFVSADTMAKSIANTGKVILYGVYFNSDEDKIRDDSVPTMKEIATLLSRDPQLKIRVIGHTDNQGTADYNLDLSRRRAAAVIHELTSKYSVSGNRLDAFGCGLYCPLARNDTEDGRAKNRRVELIKW